MILIHRLEEIYLYYLSSFIQINCFDYCLEQYQAVKEGRQLDQSDYQEFKIQQDNIGFKMLQKMGWTDGQGLGASGEGITAPINK